MDGYTPTIFFDFEDYINKICNDIVLLDEFSNQLIPCTYEEYLATAKDQIPSRILELINN